MSTSTRIPFYKRTFTESEIKAVSKCIRSGHLTQGRLVEQFEEDFRRYVGSKYAVAVNSCTSALFLGLMRTKPKKVSIPSMTFASVASSILHAGAKLNWIDASWAGSRYPLIPDNARLGIVNDSAHALHRNDAKGCRSDLICYSFYPTKNLSGMEGGMIATDNKEHAEWFKKARYHARVGKSWDYIIEFPAWRCNMTDVQAALGIEYLKRIDAEARQRKALLDLYNDLLGTNIRSDHIFMTIVGDRDDFIKFMADKGIECSMHFKPVHKQPAFKKQYKKLPLTEHFEDLIVSLPLFPSMLKKEVKEVCRYVTEWNKKHPLPKKEYVLFGKFLRS